MKKILFAIALFLSITGSVYALEQLDDSILYDGGAFVADIPMQQIGNGFSGSLEYLELRTKVSNSNAEVTLLSCTVTPVISSGGCTGTGVGYALKGTDFIITDIGGGAYNWSLSTSSPYVVLDPALYYTIIAPVWNESSIYGSASSSLFLPCIPYDATGNCGSVNSWYLIFNVNPSQSSATRIITVTPLTGTVIATSTEFNIGAIGYTNADQWNDTYKVNIEFSNDTARYVNPKIDYTKKSWSYYISPLNWNKSATTSLDGVSTSEPIGRYTVRTTITKEKSSFFGLWTSDTIVVATTTNFILATSTGYDQLVGDVTLLTGDISTTTVQLLKDNCRIDWAGSFSLYSCLTGIISMVFVPDQAQIYKLKDKLDEVILIKFPFGYVTRMVDIALDDTATSSLPSISVTMPSGLGEFSGMNFHFAPFDYISTTTNSFLDGMVDPVTGQSVEDILTLPVQMLVFGICITIVWNDLTQPGHRRGKEENEDNNKTT